MLSLFVLFAWLFEWFWLVYVWMFAWWGFDWFIVRLICLCFRGVVDLVLIYRLCYLYCICLFWGLCYFRFVALVFGYCYFVLIDVLYFSGVFWVCCTCDCCLLIVFWLLFRCFVHLVTNLFWVECLLGCGFLYGCYMVCVFVLIVC